MLFSTMESNQLKELASQKEKEWREITDLRIQTLEADCKEKARMLDEEKRRFTKLKDDFKYNLKLLGDRDKELEQYDVLFRDLKQKITKTSTENSELKICIDELKTSIQREAKSREDLQIHYQQRLRAKQKEIDSFRKTKDGEVEEERREYQVFKKKLERRVTEVEGELEIQKRELTAGFDDALKKREHEFRVKMDEMNSQVLAHQFKTKILSKELEMLKSAQNKTNEEFQQVETNHQQLEKHLRNKDWELADLKSVKDARISELEGQVERSESLVKQIQEDYKKRYAEMDRYSREKEAALTKMKEAVSQREDSHMETIRQLQSTIEQNQIEIRQLRWANQDLTKEKELQMEKLSGELCELREKWDYQVMELSKDQVSKDIQQQDLRLQVEKLTQDLTERKEDINRYKRDLSAALERESTLERSKAQLDLDWQRRYEDAEREQYSKSEDLMSKLTSARDEAMATLKEKERMLQDQGDLIQQIKRERDLAFATLRQHGLSLSNKVKATDEQGEQDIEDLRTQNKNLMVAIGEMRQAMEELGQGVSFSSSDKKPVVKVTRDYTVSLENQVSALKKEKRDLEEELEKLRKDDKPPKTVVCSETVPAEVSDNVIVRSHVQSLNDSIGGLRAEKVELTAQLKKQQARIQYLEKTLEETSKQQRQKQVELDQLQYEINTEGRRHKTESAALRQRVSELEMEVAETRKEADEYYRGGLERNMEVTTLRAEVSNLKLELAEKRPPVNFGAQELMIQQLEEELHRLRKHGHATNPEPVRTGQGLTTNATLEHLQTKLKQAAKHIAQLARDKQHLIEIGNRQRAELLKAGLAPPSAATVSKPEPLKQTRSGRPQTPPSRQMTERMQGKLDALEKLQYQLTKQELEYAQKFSPVRSGHPQRSESAREDYRDRPVSILKKSGESFTSGGLGDTLQSMSSMTDGRTEDELMVSLTSAGGESLQHVWQILNQPSPSPVPSRHQQEEPTKDLSHSQNSMEWFIQGKKAGLLSQQPEVKGKSKPSVRPKKNAQKSKIRNYNMKDNTSR